MSLDLGEYTQPLARTPLVLRAVIECRPDTWLDSRHAKDVMSPRQAVAHLVLCERESWIKRAKRFLGPDTPIPGVSQNEDELLAATTVPELLDEFDELRPKCIQELIGLNLTANDLEIQRIHPRLGTVTLGQLLNTWVAHDLYHLGQIFKSYSALYVDKIGPWQEFLNLPNFN